MMLLALVATVGCDRVDPAASSANLIHEPRAIVEERVASIEEELARFEDPEERFEARRQRFEEEMTSLRARSVDSVDSVEQQLELRDRLMGSDQAHADALAAAQAQYERHESYQPTAGDLELSDREREHSRGMEEEWERRVLESEPIYPDPPPMPEDMVERDRRIEAERRILEAAREAGAIATTDEVLP